MKKEAPQPQPDTKGNEMVFMKKLSGYLIPAIFLLLTANVAAGETTIRDFTTLNQNPLSWLTAGDENKPMLLEAIIDRLNRESDALYFFPWHQKKPYHSMKHAAWGVKKYANNPGYDKNGRSRPQRWIGDIIKNTHISDYPKDIFPAITVRNTHFRILPTRERHSNLPLHDANFDNFQQSTVPTGTPVLVTLRSLDKKWFLVETRHLIGWVKAEDIARVSPDFVKTWENGRYIAVTKDNTPVSIDKKVVYKAQLGSVFPVIGKGGGDVFIWMAARDAMGNAFLLKATIPANGTALKPLPFTPRNVASIARELIGGKYGWGGLGGKRDCSSTLRDLFSPFGILLPRNSMDQAGAGRFVSFLGLSSERKRDIILQQGVPWRTLLWIPGHIMLYIGTAQGEPVIFHNFWKIATVTRNGGKGRLVVGRTAITTLCPGRELPDIDVKRANILSGLAGMTILGEQNENLPGLPLPLGSLFTEDAGHPGH
jgi:hypothetical protein